MVNPNYHTVVFQQPVHYFDGYAGVGNFQRAVSPIRDNVTYKINEYFLRGIAYIQYVMRLLINSSPYIEQYGPVIKELPKMYQIVKAFKEISENELNVDAENITNDDRYVESNYEADAPLPKLYI